LLNGFRIISHELEKLIEKSSFSEIRKAFINYILIKNEMFTCFIYNGGTSDHMTICSISLCFCFLSFLFIFLIFIITIPIFCMFDFTSALGFGDIMDCLIGLWFVLVLSLVYLNLRRWPRDKQENMSI
jgi:hypothetical protein